MNLPFPVALLAGASHPESALLIDVMVLAVAAIIAALLLGKLKLPVVSGFLLAGAVAGPHGLGLVRSSDDLTMLGEIGVALLLFTIGLEFSRERIKAAGPLALLAGVAQIGLTIGIAFIGGMAFGLTSQQALFLGMVLSLSSTAIVLRSLKDRNELEAPHGRLILGTLIMQDLAIVPMIIAVPLLRGDGGSLVTELGSVALKATLILALTWLSARYVVNWVLEQISALRSRDIFLLTVLTLSLGLAGITAKAGLSPALGAFMAGIMLSNSDYAHRTLSEVIPLRDVFFSLFFVLIGMLFDMGVLFRQPLLVFGLLGVLLLGKGIVATLGGMFLRFPARIAIMFGFGLAQFGEFGYILLMAGQAEGGILRDNLAGLADALLCAGLVSMFLTPLILQAAPHFSAGQRLLRPLERLLRARGMDEADEEHGSLSGHVIIAGMGPSGRMLVEALRAAGRPYLVLELNSRTVQEQRQQGEPVYYGDATAREVLEHAGIERASALALMFNDDGILRRAISLVRDMRADIPVVVRTPLASQVQPLSELGATRVVAGELAAGEALTEAVLELLDDPPARS
ncbi:MAG: cation:proton antiporter [Planctomycetales bacterium]|nr:cation:proton antiporter [bacterium]UNM09724.1 MAG: cation:proton antiporter [Planctomycetales bacterium]